MDVTQTIVYKLRGKESGQWETCDEAPGSAKIGNRVWEGVFQREVEVRVDLLGTCGPAVATHYKLSALLLASHLTLNVMHYMIEADVRVGWRR